MSISSRQRIEKTPTILFGEENCGNVRKALICSQRVTSERLYAVEEEVDKVFSEARSYKEREEVIWVTRLIVLRGMEQRESICVCIGNLV